MRILGLCGIFVAAMLLAAPPAPAAAADVPASLADQLDVLLPAVVEVETLIATPHGKMYSIGSGFVIDPKGVIVTNRHVVAGSYEILVTVPGIGKLKAEPMYISEGIDLALLKIDAGRALPFVKLGDSDKVRVGDRVMLLGDPLGVGESVSFGVVSALNRDIGETLYDHFIQTDAALNHGNSGGAMVDMAGEVVAINTGLSSSPGNTGSVGVGYSMPINDAKFIINQFLRDGQVIVGTVGVHAQKVTEDLATAFGLTAARGAIVTGVDAHGPADGKILPGDIVLTVGAQDASDTHAVARLIAVTPPGQTLDVTLLRAGAEQAVTLAVAASTSGAKTGLSYLGRAPAQSMEFATPSDPGMELAPIDEALRHKFALPGDREGVVVTDVSPKGVAALRKIAVGDVILAVGGTPVRTPAEVRQQLRAVSDRHVPSAALLVAGDRNTRWVALPLEADR